MEPRILHPLPHAGLVGQHVRRGARLSDAHHPADGGDRFWGVLLCGTLFQSCGSLGKHNWPFDDFDVVFPPF